MASTIQVDKIQDTGGNTILSSNSTGTFTYEAASGANFTALPAANLTGTIAAISGANVTSLDADNVSAGTLAVARGGTGTTSYSPGITNAQSFRLTTSFTGDAIPIASNWEEVDTDGYGAIGSAVSESSGIFSFSATGIYFIQFQWAGRFNADEKTYRGYIDTTLNNSSYSEASEGRLFMQQTSSDNGHNSSSITFIFDVSDTTNRKCRFSIDAVGAAETLGNTNLSYTQATFIRLGDT